MTSIEPSANEAVSVEDDFTDIELAELEDFERPDPVRAAEVTAPGLTQVAAPRPPTARADLDAANATAASLQAHADNLVKLDEAELADHVEYYQHAHAELQRALSDIDSA